MDRLFDVRLMMWTTLMSCPSQTANCAFSPISWGICVSRLPTPYVVYRSWDMRYFISISGSHLWFITDPNIGHSYEYSSSVARPRKHGYSRWNFVAITYTTEDTSAIYVLPVHGRHFDFQHGFLSSVIFVLAGNSAVLKNIVDMMMPFSLNNLYKIISTDICCSGHHRVTTGHYSIGELPKCVECVPRRIGESAPLNSYGNQSYSRKTEGVVIIPPPLSEG